MLIYNKSDIICHTIVDLEISIYPILNIYIYIFISSYPVTIKAIYIDFINNSNKKNNP